LTQSSDTIADLRALVNKLEEDIAKGYSPSNTSTSLQDISQLLKSSPKEDEMLQIVCKQRDRFKNHIQELEAKNRDVTRQSQDTEGQIKTLQSDNVKLYEKIKYLQSYYHLKDQDGRGKDPELGERGLVEGKYKQMYEESVNPFVLFHQKEKLEREKSLNTAERMTLQTGRFLLAHKYSRLFIFIYTIIMHVLVLLTLYKLAHTTSHSIPLPVT